MLELYREYFYIVELTKRYIEQIADIQLPEILQRNIDKNKLLNNIKDLVDSCRRCKLHLMRKNTVFGEGNPDADVMVIGEAPGAQEDIQGRPFVGEAGQLLTRMLKSIDVSRETVYITNVVKCRPENNRNPYQNEIDACNMYLRLQIRIINPKILLCMGNFAAKTLLKTTHGITKLRGRFFKYNNSIKLLPTYHPAALLYHPDLKKDAWYDLQMLQKELNQIIHN
jgi:DNA polymerase